MKGGTLFSGIGAPECAAPGIDWRWCAEIDPFASAVHKERFPGVRNLGDVTKIDPDAVEPVDLIVFGSPCQSFSVAGKRLGLDDPRGNLALVALRLVAAIRPRWFLFENVSGLLSSDEGRDFGAFLGAVEQCGYGWAYRTLDAQFAGVPQRRRRVFVVGHLGDWRSAAAVLFEPASLRGHPAPGREKGQRVAFHLDGGPHADRGEDANLIPDIAWALQERDAKGADSDTKPGHLIVAPLMARSSRGSTQGLSTGFTTDEHIVTHAMAYDITGAQHAIAYNIASVRRLLPIECERLMGLPDNWTDITYRGRPASDGPRYRALGNSMAVPVVQWIIDRIGLCHHEQLQEAAD